jgi:hypothetical protein
MMDYWISFASTLDPNDDKGVKREWSLIPKSIPISMMRISGPLWAKFTPSHQAVMQLHAENATMIPDDFRVEPIEFINVHSAYFDH